VESHGQVRPWETLRRVASGQSAAFLHVAVLSAAILAVAGRAEAQVLYGTMVGRVSDPSEAAIAGATVTIIHRETNLAREAATGGDGAYRFVNLMPGTYTVRVTLAGFKERLKEDVPVSANTVARVDLRLEMSPFHDAVTVESSRTLLQTDTGDLHAELKSGEITALPLGNYRNYQTLLNLVPGTTPARFENAISDTPARGLSTNINGTASNNNNTRLDGATAVYVFLPHHTVYVAPAETVSTVNVSTASFDAEQGMAGGAAVTVLTRSGTNDFHGSGFWLHEDASLRARNWANSGDKPDSRRNMGGVTLGGPIIKDKLFFFGSWEGHYMTSPSTRTGTVPTEAMRNGDFSAYGTTIYDPATGNADGTGRTPFPGNVITPGRISPIAAAIQATIPLPTRADTSGNYTATGPVQLDRNNFDGKLNYTIGQAVQVWAKYSQMNALVDSGSFLGEAGGVGFGGGTGRGDTKVRIGTVGLTWTLSPKVVIDATIAATRMDQGVLVAQYGNNVGTDVLGIPGTNGDGGSHGDIRASGMPGFLISGFEGLGGVDGWAPVFRNDRTYNLSTNMTYATGRHEVRGGLDVVRIQLDEWQSNTIPRGGFILDGGATALGPTGSPDPFNAYAQFLLGLTTEAVKSIEPENMTGREWQFAVYLRDRWQVTRRLTLNLGLRFEEYPLMTRADRGIEYYDDTTNQVLLGGRGGNPKDLGIQVRHPRFLPRVGFAYRVDDGDVFRGGYGVTVSPMPLSRPLRGMYPLVISQHFVSAGPYVPFSTLEQGIPPFYGPDLSSGILDLPTAADMASPYADHLNRGYIQSWNLTWERRLPWDMSLATSYVGTMTTHQLGFYDINAAGAGQGWAGAPLFQRFGRTALTLRLDGWLSSNYHSLQVALNKPFSKGFFVKGAYTWSKAMNRTDDDGWSNVLWNHPSVLDKNYGLAGYDRTHIFQLGFVAELPFGRKGSGVLDAVIRNWALNGIVSAFTGTPFTVTASGASVNAPGNQQTADLVGTPVRLGGIGAGNPYYDPAAWAPVTEPRFGNTGRNSVRGPGWWNVDLGVFRRFPIRRTTLEARVEAFNLTNTPHFKNPDGHVNSPGFMTITSAQPDERQVRLGLRVSF
jgi:carboxypeptidase family protein/TonB-dependent receptor-like protein